MLSPAVIRGPSPRVWGEQVVKHPSGETTRTIPTRVGRTSRIDPRSARSADHPHACGENITIRSISRIVIGPSPRVWGELIRHGFAASRGRTIPTRVGRTHRPAGSVSRTSDHPHACGENRYHRVIAHVWCGPSPRVWGEPPAFQVIAEDVRTIPTRVGRTIVLRCSYAVIADHPHACGENNVNNAIARPETGPSPRVWGEQ